MWFYSVSKFNFGFLTFLLFIVSDQFQTIFVRLLVSWTLITECTEGYLNA